MGLQAVLLTSAALTAEVNTLKENLELLLGMAELVLGPLEVLLQSFDLRSQCRRGQQHSLQSHIDIFS